MMNEHCGDSEHLVTFKDGRWRLGKRSGPVAATIPIGHHRHFCELAVLVSPGRRALRYAARVAQTDQWLYFNRLHSWMYPLVEELVGMRERCARIAELVEKTHLLTQ